MKHGVSEFLVGRSAALLLRTLERTDIDRASDLCGAAARRLGPLTRAHRIGRENLQAAFPERDPAWIDGTLRGAWENLGRVAGEYVHLGRIWDFDPDNPGSGRVETDAAPLFYELLQDKKPALCFAAHLGNWELPAVAAAAHGLPSAAVYRMPNNRAVAAEIARIRSPLMGRLIRGRAEAGLEMAGALERGEHLGMLVDQRFSRGVDVTFFGRRCKANPTLARLARRFACPVVGVRVVRLPERRFRIDAVGPLDLPRVPGGSVDVVGTMQMITSIIENWIREYPDQWLWFHRRWR
jgi:Kdo2-lipid IVA lauroyltransferase/acyltransferase